MADLIAVAVDGVLAEETSALVQAQFPGQTVTPSADFTFPWNGVLIPYRQGDTQVVTPDLLAALTAANAPFSQP